MPASVVGEQVRIVMDNDQVPVKMGKNKRNYYPQHFHSGRWWVKDTVGLRRIDQIRWHLLLRERLGSKDIDVEIR